MIAVATVACFGMSANRALASPGAYKVLFVYGLKSCNTTPPLTFRSDLAAQPGISTVDLWDESVSTPSDATLDQYDMVVAMSDCGGYRDATSLGNNLADFADQGGVVVEFAWNTEGDVAGYALAGRWASGGYDPYIPGTDQNTNVTLGTYDPTSPLMQGVTSLQTKGNANPTLAPGATRVALWNDGQEAIAYKGEAVAVNGAIGDEGGPSYWSGDFARVALNAVTWLGRHNLTVTKNGTGLGTVTSGPSGINCGASCSSPFNYGATVTLTASAATGSSFAGWSGGGCSGTGACNVTMSAAQAVTATFSAILARVSGATESRQKFHASHKPKLATATRKRARIGTTFKYQLDEAAAVSFSFTQPGAGRTVNGKCVARTKHNKHKSKCTLLAGSLSFAGHVGLNTVKFDGWLTHSRKLKPGKYTLVITATTPGVGATSQKLKFTVLK